MIQEEKFSNKFKSFFTDYCPKEKINNADVFLTRSDGVLLYGNTIKDKDSIGVLMGGVWQAAKALSSFIPKGQSGLLQEDIFRLSFDTSSKGIYILPFNLGGSEYYLGVIYYDEMSPGVIKSKMRRMLSELEGRVILDNNCDSQQSDNKTEYLFKEITDTEMDEIFSFVEN